MNTKKALIVGLMIASVAGFATAQSDHMVQGEPNVTYRSADGAEVGGYLATPPASYGDGPHPAVIMVHEWWGLNVDVQRLARALAAEGYIVLAPDLFRGSYATTAQAAMGQLRSTPQDQIATDLDAALAFLQDHNAVDPDRIASMGFCFGGTQSMYLGTRARGLAAVVTFYGSGPIQSRDQLGRMRQNAPVLGVFGEEDGSIPVSEVRGFESALNAANIDNTITVYPGVGHAFVKSTTYRNGGAPEEAWNQLVAFFDDVLM
jgi:carboxymethylenebutenolidase